MQKHLRTSVVALLLLLWSLPAFAQAILPLEVGVPTLSALSAARPIVGYEFTQAQARSHTLTVTFLGQPAPLRAEWYAPDGQLISTTQITANTQTPPIALPVGTSTLLITLEGTTTANARLTLMPTELAPPPQPTAELAPPPQPTTESPPPTPIIIPSGINAGMPLPLSGMWQATHAMLENNCPLDLPLEEALIPADGTLHALNIGDESTLALDLHRVAVGGEVDESPEFFFTENSEIGTFLVIPRIMTEPYTYLYRVVDAEFVTLDYFQRLALSDCELYVSLELVRVDDLTSGTDGTQTGGAGGGSLSITPMPTAPNTTGAATDTCEAGTLQSEGGQWFFNFDEPLLEAIRNGYGQTLSFDLRLVRDIGTTSAIELELFASNGAIFGYPAPLQLNSTEWVNVRVPLSASAGWLESWIVTPTDMNLSFSMQQSSSLLLLGNAQPSNIVCLRNVQVIDSN